MSNTYSFLTVQAALAPSGNAADAINLANGAQVSDEGITIEMHGDKNTLTAAADGGGMNSLHAEKTGQVTARFLKTSPVNSALQSLYNAQSANPTGVWGNNTITVNNTASGDSHTCTGCAFKRKPRVTYGKDGDMMEWVFDAVTIDSILGVY